MEGGFVHDRCCVTLPLLSLSLSPLRWHAEARRLDGAAASAGLLAAPVPCVARRAVCSARGVVRCSSWWSSSSLASTRRIAVFSRFRWSQSARKTGQGPTDRTSDHCSQRTLWGHSGTQSTGGGHQWRGTHTATRTGTNRCRRRAEPRWTAAAGAEQPTAPGQEQRRSAGRVPPARNHLSRSTTRRGRTAPDPSRLLAHSEFEIQADLPLCPPPRPRRARRHVVRSAPSTQHVPAIRTAAHTVGQRRTERTAGRTRRADHAAAAENETSTAAASSASTRAHRSTSIHWTATRSRIL